MRIIRKFFPIQAHFSLNNIQTPASDSPEAPPRTSDIIERSRRVYTKRVDNILLSPKVSETEYEKLKIIHPQLRSVLAKYPSLWDSILISIHTNQGAFDKKTGSLIEEKSTPLKEEILPLFMRYNAEQAEQENLITPDVIYENIINNPRLYKYAIERSKHNRSFIEFPTSKFRKLSRHQISQLIRTILIKNGTRENLIETSYADSFKYVFDWMKEIFAIHVGDHIGTHSSLDELVEQIHTAIQSGGFHSEVGADILRNLYAWGDARPLRKTIDEVGRLLGSGGRTMQKLLENAGIVFSPQDITRTQSGNATIYAVKAQYILKNGGNVVPVEVSWREKSEKSVLLKLRTDHRYNHADTLRDTIGISIAPEDRIGLHTEDRKEIFASTAGIYPPLSFVAKNK